MVEKAMKPSYKSLHPLILPTVKDLPTDWSSIFDRSAPMELEIGFGDGEYLVRCAEEEPEKNWLGLELRWSCIKRAIRKMEQRGVENARVMKLDGRAALKYLFPPRSVGGICSLFPSPWPKRRSMEKRTFDTSFLTLVASRLCDGGEVYLVTDQAPYAEWLLEGVPGDLFEVNRTRGDIPVQTRYQRKWKKEGVADFQEVRLRKIRHPILPDVGESKMKTHRIDTFYPERFSPKDEVGEISVVFKEYLYDPKKEKAMVAVFLSEDGFQKDFWVRIERKEKGWHIAPAFWQDFLPTLSAQKALDLVYKAAKE